MVGSFELQMGALFWAALCLFVAGARHKGIEMTSRTWWEIIQTAAIVVLVFALLTDGRGCTTYSAYSDDADQSIAP